MVSPADAVDPLEVVDPAASPVDPGAFPAAEEAVLLVADPAAFRPVTSQAAHRGGPMEAAVAAAAAP